MAFQPINRAQVVKALQEFGPMTIAALAERMEWTEKKVGVTIWSSRCLKPKQVFRIARYEPALRQVSVFAAEAGEDARKPPRNKSLRQRQKSARWREKNRALHNIRSKAAKNRRAGRAVATNPWMQLAPPEIRPAMSRAHRRAAQVVA